MVTELIALREMREEVRDMLLTCFEGAVRLSGTSLELILSNGQRFLVSVEKAE